MKLLLLLLSVYLLGVNCDTPANCTYDDIQGSWIFYEGSRNGEHNIDCQEFGDVVNKTRVTLLYPNIAIDEYTNRGTWTLIYNQGFEVTVNGRSYFAFSDYHKDSEGNVTSYCDRTLNGWSRDVTVRNWACFRGSKVQKVAPKFHIDTHHNFQAKSEIKYKPNPEFIDQINSIQSSWTAKHYPEYLNLTQLDLLRKAGGAKSHIVNRPKTSNPNVFQRVKGMALPDSFDWRNVNGENYVSPIRNQEACGSCYAFASMALLEARERILTRNSVQKVYSPQDIVGCSNLSQGCDGGFPYLIAGRYAQDQGVVEDTCYPYEAKDDTCKTKSSCSRHYAAKYRYVGGYFGACNEEEMKLALVRGGPLAVGFEVYDDFLHYSGGVYKHTGLRDKFNPLELTNHAVLLVGYGATDDGQKYWIVKNSWGTGWGEDGFFRISRGNDECGMESMAVEVVPIP